jgi:hypothetical protein
MLNNVIEINKKKIKAKERNEKKTQRKETKYHPSE